MPNETLLAIDPGTHRTGLVVFNGQELVDWQLAVPRPKATLEFRMMDLVAAVDEVAARHPGLSQVACEKAPGHGAKIPPSPELIAFVRRLSQWARAKKAAMVPVPRRQRCGRGEAQGHEGQAHQGSDCTGRKDAVRGPGP